MNNLIFPIMNDQILLRIRKMLSNIRIQTPAKKNFFIAFKLHVEH